MATKLIDLIESVNADDLPTNEFTIEDKDPMVILGKLNEVIAYLETLQATINASDSKANEALQRAIQAVADATQALSVANGIDAKAIQALANAIEAVGTANTALSASNTALSTANTAISTANTALSSANSAVVTAEDALSNSQTAVSTANTAETKAQEALDQVVDRLGTKVYRDTQLLTSLDIKPIEGDIADNTTAITTLQNGKVDKVTGKQLSTEDFTTAEKTKLAGLSNYDDTQVQADITALQTRATNIENKNNEQDSNIENINEKFSSYLKITDLINKIYPIGSIYLSTSNVSPASFIGGTWEKLPANKALWLVNANAGAEIPAGLPNIRGTVSGFAVGVQFDNTPPTGVFIGSSKISTGVNTWGNSNANRAKINFDARQSNSVYGKSTTVQPPAYTIYGWRRVS